MGDRTSQRFQVHTTGAGNRGSKLFTLLFGGAIVLVGGGGYWFYSDTDGQIGHVRARDRLATISAHALGMRGVPAQAEQPLLDALEQGDPPLRAASARALGTLGKEEMVAFLGNRATTDPVAEVRVAALEALTQNGVAMPSSRWLGQALSDRDDKVKVAACRAVGELGLEHLAFDVIPHLNYHERKVVAAAQAALEKLSGTTCGTDTLAWNKLFEERRGR